MNSSSPPGPDEPSSSSAGLPGPYNVGNHTTSQQQQQQHHSAQQQHRHHSLQPQPERAHTSLSLASTSNSDVEPSPVTDQRPLQNVFDQLLNEMESRYPDMPDPFRQRLMSTVELIQQATNNAPYRANTQPISSTATLTNARLDVANTDVVINMDEHEALSASAPSGLDRQLETASRNSSDEPSSDHVFTDSPVNVDGDGETTAGAAGQVVEAAGNGQRRSRRHRRIFRVRHGSGGANESGSGGQVDRSRQFIGQQAEVREIIRIAQTPEAKMLLSVFLGVLPFLMAIGCKVFVDHFWRLSAVLCAVVFFMSTNLTVVNHLATCTPVTSTAGIRSRFRRFAQYVKASLGPCIWLYLVLGYMYDQELWSPLVFRFDVPESLSTERSSICTSLWRIFVADSTAKFAAMLLKVLVCLVCCVSPRRRCRLFPVIEYTSQLYRYLLPITVWCTYLLSHGHNDGWFYVACNYAFLSVYVVAKIWQVIMPVRHVYSSLLTCVRRSAFGSAPTAEALAKASDTCSICFGSFTAPIQLSCEHIFCEGCIATWLDREKTCPICRAQVSQEDNKYKDGSTTCLIQIF